VLSLKDRVRVYLHGKLKLPSGQSEFFVPVEKKAQKGCRLAGATGPDLHEET
jgi:hypothetical protein